MVLEIQTEILIFFDIIDTYYPHSSEDELRMVRSDSEHI